MTKFIENLKYCVVYGNEMQKKITVVGIMTLKEVLKYLEENFSVEQLNSFCCTELNIGEQFELTNEYVYRFYSIIRIN